MSSLDAEMVFGHDYDEIAAYFHEEYDQWLRCYVDGVNLRGKERIGDCCAGHCCEGKLIKDANLCWILLLPFIVIGPIFVGICH